MQLAPAFALLLSAGGLALAGAATLVLADRLMQRRQALLRRFTGRRDAAAPVDDSAASPALLRREPTAGFFSRLPALPGTTELAAFYAEMRKVALIVMICVSALVATALYQTLALGMFLALVCGMVVALLVLMIWARMRHQKRLVQIEESVPEAIDLIVRALRVGLPIGTSIQTAGNELTGPLAEEFSECARQVSYGQDQIRALREMAERCRNQNLRFLAAAVALQSATGGNLAEVLERLGEIARGRMQLQRKVRAITAEAKWSGRFLSAFPIIATLGLLTVNPNYFSEIADKSFFYPMLAVVGVLLVMNMMFMRWLIKID